MRLQRYSYGMQYFCVTRFFFNIYSNKHISIKLEYVTFIFGEFSFG